MEIFYIILLIIIFVLSFWCGYEIGKANQLKKTKKYLTEKLEEE